MSMYAHVKNPIFFNIQHHIIGIMNPQEFNATLHTLSIRSRPKSLDPPRCSTRKTVHLMTLYDFSLWIPVMSIYHHISTPMFSPVICGNMQVGAISVVQPIQTHPPNQFRIGTTKVSKNDAPFSGATTLEVSHSFFKILKPLPRHTFIFHEPHQGHHTAAACHADGAADQQAATATAIGQAEGRQGTDAIHCVVQGLKLVLLRRFLLTEWGRKMKRLVEWSAWSFLSIYGSHYYSHRSPN